MSFSFLAPKKTTLLPACVRLLYQKTCNIPEAIIGDLDITHRRDGPKKDPHQGKKVSHIPTECKQIGIYINLAVA